MDNPAKEILAEGAPKKTGILGRLST